MELKNNLDWALYYRSIGWHVFPCHSIRNGRCSCGNETCASSGKHPRTKNGFKDATSDETTIRNFWQQWPDANIGSATGTISGFTVIDLDVKHGKSVQEMMREMSVKGFNIPATVCSKTGKYLDRGDRGTHFFLKSSDTSIKSATDLLHAAGIRGVDVRGDGGYVILPPSGHVTGVSYEWQVSPMDTDLAELPSWVLQTQKINNERATDQDWEEIFSRDVLEGMRNDTATKVAGKLLQPMPEDAWPLGWELFKGWNAHLTKPLAEMELKSVWKSISKAEKLSRKKKAKELPMREPRVRIATCPKPEKLVTFDEWANTVSANFPYLRFSSEVSLSVVTQFLIKDVTNPFALVLVDVPSSGKTIEINFFDDIPELTYATDKFTPASFVSNAANVKKERLAEIDLLPRIQYRMFLIRDFATLFSRREEDLKEMLGILTRVLDGEGLNTDSGVHGQRQYVGEYLFMLLAASTPIPPSVMKVMGNLGSRLFFLTINSPDKSEGELAAQVVDLSYKVKEKTCRLATRNFLYGLWNAYPQGIDWDKKNDNSDLLVIIARCAMLLASLRGVINVWQDDFTTTEYKYSTPLIEKPDRVNQLFYNLARGHALACGRTQIAIEDIRAIIELCIDGAPTARARLFRKLIEYRGAMTTSEVEKELNCSKPTALKEMKTLEILKVCSQREKEGADNQISLSDEFKWFLSDECVTIQGVSLLAPKVRDGLIKQI